MKQVLFFITGLFCISFLTAQSKLGDMACVYVTTPDLDSSIAVYEKLGFAKINSNTYPSPWAQVSDGSLIIMMRKDATPFISLAYYTSDLDKTIAQLEKDSVVFVQKPKETDLVKRYYIKSPDGFIITIANNLGGFQKATGTTLLNMPPSDYNNAGKYPNKQCGAFGEYAQPVTDLAASVVFWKKLGFTMKADMKAPYPHAILSDGLMLLGLHQTNNFNYPAITYFGINTEKRVQALKEKGLSGFKEMPDKKNLNFTTWEKQHFFIFSLGM